MREQSFFRHDSHASLRISFRTSLVGPEAATRRTPSGIVFSSPRYNRNSSRSILDISRPVKTMRLTKYSPSAFAERAWCIEQVCGDGEAPNAEQKCGTCTKSLTLFDCVPLVSLHTTSTSACDSDLHQLQALNPGTRSCKTRKSVFRLC